MELNRGEFETEEADLTGEVQEAIYIREEEEGEEEEEEELSEMDVGRLAKVEVWGCGHRAEGR